MEKTIDPAHEIGENVTTIERSQLLSITLEQVKKWSLSESKIRWLMMRWMPLYRGGATLKQLYFVNYSFFWVWEMDLMWISVGYKSRFYSVQFISRCSWRVIAVNNPYNKIEVLDLTGNNLTKLPERFVDVLLCAIVPFKSVGE